MHIMNAAALATLNAAAEELFADDTEKDGVYSLRKAAAALHKVATSDSCEIYQNDAGEIVNCWIAPQFRSFDDADSIEATGSGFDDNVEWYTDTDTTEQLV